MESPLAGAVAAVRGFDRHSRAVESQPSGCDVYIQHLRLGAVLWLGLIAWIIDPAWLAWSGMPLSVWLRWTGLLVSTGLLLLWTFRSLGKNLTGTVVTRHDHTLIVHGPYRWIRLFCLLVARTRTEEENLVARFGHSYRAYMERTGKFVPRIGAHRRGR
jgi:protein-S-isoprenylcysteine O-methyltransferase Ste14